MAGLSCIHSHVAGQLKTGDFGVTLARTIDLNLNFFSFSNRLSQVGSHGGGKFHRENWSGRLNVS